MLHEIESGEDIRKEEPLRYRLAASIPDVALKATVLGLLCAFMAFAGYQSFGALNRVLTCAAPVKASSTDVYGNAYTYDRFGSAGDSIKACIPANLHASWLPSVLGAVSMTALAVLALVLLGYLLRLSWEYIDQQLQVNPAQSRYFHTVPDQIKHAVKGLTFASGIFMLASVAVYCVIYMVALT